LVFVTVIDESDPQTSVAVIARSGTTGGEFVPAAVDLLEIEDIYNPGRVTTAAGKRAVVSFDFRSGEGTSGTHEGVHIDRLRLVYELPSTPDAPPTGTPPATATPTNSPTASVSPTRRPDHTPTTTSTPRIEKHDIYLPVLAANT
jgi:hypothetical protein